MKRVLWTAAIAASLACAGSASARAQNLPAGLTITATAKGKVLSDAKGMSLYTFDEDKAGKPACVDKCVEKWPPMKATGPASGDFSIVKHPQAGDQWAFRGKPLYTWHKDKARQAVRRGR